ncbi:sigma-54-dependent transcriptional regulator [Gracilinema caldarium]|uniref:Two component, sigma54 specific, transcriptional regulator n=1 Tax=Gracilinema caldarium (strain ATCC 51460 / DSM 7334 / H1) TaxID=744872 RepID=F8EYH2_GRAC1|nr:sigma-54 dependent transcriptional regulator [Gracilinema caldarium]AEJ18404.1 putative two component, sigma54 specific, transcriptional regulator [Gracilinema caldarium DSM 7334]
MYSVLCIDDAEEQLQMLTLQLIDTYHVITCQKPQNAIAQITKHQPAAVILDLHMPKINGFKLLSDITGLYNPPPVLILSGHTEPLFVVRSLHLGARDFLSKPYTSTMLRYRLTKIITESPIFKTAHHQPLSHSLFIGNSKPIETLKLEIQTFANSNLPILIYGESGTGKDLVAREIHYRSPRNKGPYIVRNMGAIPPTLIESELFGCDEGAFTDAKPHAGCFEQANGGTLFLDEIAEASPTAQAALLRVIEDGYIQHLGGKTIHEVSFRLISATNKNLDSLISEKQFRSDLKYRLEGITLTIPPLRERKEDIPILTSYFVPSHEHEIANETIEKLCEYNWPGNVRQLRMCLERAKLLAGPESTIRPEHIRF